MVERIDGGAELLLSPEEAELFKRQADAQNSGDVSKSDANYQNEPNNGAQCSGCTMFVPGFPEDVGGYCTKVKSFRGPQGMIFPDGWCKFFDASADLDLESLSVEELDQIIEGLDESEKEGK